MWATSLSFAAGANPVAVHTDRALLLSTCCEGWVPFSKEWASMAAALAPQGMEWVRLGSDTAVIAPKEKVAHILFPSRKVYRIHSNINMPQPVRVVG